jgi:predicted DNA-binding protein (MmcQ/YjbR family)
MSARMKKRPRRRFARIEGEAIGSLINKAASSTKAPDAARLKKLREICLVLPEATETVKWGHPTFEAGKKIFAVLDQYYGQPCIAFRSSRKEQMKLLRDKRFFSAPYAAAHGWVCLRADGELKWPEVRDLLAASYRVVALKRMLSALAGRSTTTTSAP